MKRVILTVLFLALAIPASADPKTAGVRKGCKKSKAAFYLAGVQAGIRFKPNAAELKSKVSQVNTDKFCDCVFDGFEKTFGVEATANRLQYDQPMGTSEELLKKNQQEQQIYFMCFGKQIGQPNLKAPTPEETMQALAGPKKKK